MRTTLTFPARLPWIVNFMTFAGIKGVVLALWERERAPPVLSLNVCATVKRSGSPLQRRLSSLSVSLSLRPSVFLTRIESHTRLVYCEILPFLVRPPTRGEPTKNCRGFPHRR